MRLQALWTQAREHLKPTYAPHPGTLTEPRCRQEGDLKVTLVPVRPGVAIPAWDALTRTATRQHSLAALTALDGVSPYIVIVERGEHVLWGACCTTWWFGWTGGLSLKFLNLRVPWTLARPLRCAPAGLRLLEQDPATASALIKRSLELASQLANCQAALLSAMPETDPAIAACRAGAGTTFAWGKRWQVHRKADRNVDQYLARDVFTKKRKRRVRRALRPVQRGELQFKVLRIGDVPADQLTAPLSAHDAKYGVINDVGAYVRRLQECDDGSVRVGCVYRGAELVEAMVFGVPEEPAGWAEATMCGSQPQGGDGENLYDTVIASLIKWLLEEQDAVETLDFGTSCDEAKRRLGAEPIDTYAFIYPAHVLTKLSSQLLRRFVLSGIELPGVRSAQEQEEVE